MEVLLGFILGTLSTWLFWRYMLLLKPNISIPEYVIEEVNLKEEKEFIYRTRNLGKRQVIDISVKATICEHTGTGEEYPHRLVHKLKLDLDSANVLYPKEKTTKPWGLPNYRGFHIQQIDESTGNKVNITKLLENKQRRLIITVRSTDSISGTVVITRTLYTNDKIKLASNEV